MSSAKSACMPSGSIPSRALAALALGIAFALGGCGGGGGDTGGAPAARTGSTDNTGAGNTAVNTAISANAVAVTVKPGPADTVNLAFTSVTVCAPADPARCQTIEDVIVDTGSVGLRLFASVLSPSLALSPQFDEQGAALAECARFADVSSWGPVKVADVRLASEHAMSVPIQILADPQFSDVPADCASTGLISQTVQSFGGNGILGVGVFLQDCGIRCELLTENQVYYGCTAAACLPTAAPVAKQVQNPVSFFEKNNNGVILAFPAVPNGSAPTLTGSLTFGIGTQANNMPGAVRVLTLDENGLFTTVYKGRRHPISFIDSGSNALFFFDDSIPACALGFFCPSNTVAATATQIGADGAAASVEFQVRNAAAALEENPDHAVFASIAGPVNSLDIFDWGLPFFFGRSVFTAIEGRATPLGPGPYFAF